MTLEMTGVNQNRFFSAENKKINPHVDTLFRRHSLSVGDFYKEIKDINNTSLSLKRSDAISNLALYGCDDTLSNLVKIEYNHSEIKDIDAKNYVYCGAAITFPVNNLGMSIDNEGHLTLIKGESNDLFAGVIRKHTTGYKYKTSKLICDNGDKKFKDLYIDDSGLLIGNERDTGKSYIINISNVELDNNSDGQYVKLNLKEYTQNIKYDDLTFKVDTDRSVSYFMQDNKLFLKEIKIGGNISDYSIMYNEIKIPIGSDYSISSVKRAMGILQLEVISGDKKRILYIDPKYISNNKLSADKISHKPPQLFPSRLGSDPHEHYHAGQPFTSDRKGNFSSKHIPLFSSIVDNFRVNFKRAKQYYIEGSNIEALINMTKAIDPLVNGIKYTVSGLIKKMFKNSSGNINSKLELYDKNLGVLTSNWKHLSKVVNESLGVDKKQELSESLVNLVNEIKPKEAVHLTSANRVAAFFGIAAGGTPFLFGGPGWFAGIVGELSNCHNLTMAKTESGNIKLSFKNRDKIAATGLVGSGQGLEKTLLETKGFDYLKVMPFEANAIIVMQSTSGNDFSFEMSKEDFEEFAKQFSSSTQNEALSNIFITEEAVAEQIKENKLVFKIEAKCEARLQVSRMVNDNAYMVMPRTAVGVRLALDLLDVTSNKSESSGKSQNDFIRSKNDFKITALNHDAALYAEWKVMPIVMHGGGDDILLCYPLPLLEEGKTLAQPTPQKPLTLWERTVSSNTPVVSNDTFSTETSINNIKNIPMYLIKDSTENVKKKDTIKYLAAQDETIGIAYDILTQLRKSLNGQERSSMNKTCTINVISHYEPIISPSLPSLPSLPSSEAITNPLPGSQNSDVPGSQSYRLKRLEFRRNSELQHKEATVPMPILNFSNVNSISYDQFLGEIEFEYHSLSDRSPENTTRRLNALY